MSWALKMEWKKAVWSVYEMVEMLDAMMVDLRVMMDWMLVDE